MVSDVGGSTNVVDVLDNGIMVKKIERPRDVLELRKEHATLDSKKDPTIV